MSMTPLPPIKPFPPHQMAVTTTTPRSLCFSSPNALGKEARSAGGGIPPSLVTTPPPPPNKNSLPQHRRERL